MSSKKPVAELEGRELDAAIHEEVFRERPYVVTKGDLEAKLEMRPTEGEPLETAFRAQAMEFPEDQREIASAVPRYSTEIEAAHDVDEFMRERPGVRTKTFYIELRSRRQDISKERGLGEEFDEISFHPEQVCRDALRAVREE